MPMVSLVVRVKVRSPTQTAPYFTIVSVDFEDVLQIFHCLGKLFPCSQDGGDPGHSRHRPLVVPQRVFVCLKSTIQIAHQIC